MIATVLAGVFVWPLPGHGAPSAFSSAHAAESAARAAPSVPSGVTIPQRWLPSRGRECARSGRYKGFCQGPRRVPEPFGPEAALAAKLGLGTTKTVSTLLLGRAKPEWLAAASVPSALPMLWPVEGGSLWRGMIRGKPGAATRKVRRGHRGLDIGAPVGSPIRAAQGGLVGYADNGVGGYGNLLVLIHRDNTTTFYGHCRSIYVFPGQLVARGQIVAEVGATGIARGPHLHFEYRKNGRIRDPLKLFVEAPPEIDVPPKRSEPLGPPTRLGAQ